MISIVIPSLRPQNIKELSLFFEKNLSDYELIVISPLEIDAQCVLVKEDHPEGIYKAVQKGMKKVNGEYVLHMPDDSCPHPGAIEAMIDFSKSFHGKLFVGSWRAFDDRYVFEQGAYYGRHFSAFPFMRTDDIKAVGELMDTYYTSFYGDPDLSLRVQDIGGIVAVCPDAWMRINSKHDQVKQDSLSKYEQEDRDKFIKRWSKYGPYKGYEHFKYQYKGTPP